MESRCDRCDHTIKTKKNVCILFPFLHFLHNGSINSTPHPPPTPAFLAKRNYVTVHILFFPGALDDAEKTIASNPFSDGYV